MCEALVRRTGATVLVVHHTNKGSTADTANQNAARGSSALVDGARFVMNLKSVAQMLGTGAGKSRIPEQVRRLPEHKQRLLVAVSVTKNNYGPVGEETWLRRGAKGVLHHVRELAPLAASEQQLQRGVIAQLVRAAPPPDSRGYWTRTAFLKKHGRRRPRPGQRHHVGLGRQKLGKLLDDMVRTKYRHSNVSGQSKTLLPPPTVMCWGLRDQSAVGCRRKASSRSAA